VRPTAYGNFSLREQFDKDQRRQVLLARLTDPTTRQDLFPPLYDAVLTFVEDERLTVRGIERDPFSRKMTAQAWLLELDRVRPRETEGK